MKSSSTLTIIIPAYNEAHTIGLLLADLAKQQTHTISVTEIQVISDGSDDDTVAVVKKASQQYTLSVKCVSHSKRQGKAVRLNEAFKHVTTDIAVVLDADIRIFDPLFLDTLTEPIRHHQTDLTSAEVKELEPRTFLQQVLRFSMEWKRTMFVHYQNGDNLFTCHGRSRAFSRRLYQQLRFQHSINEDAYSYLFAITHGYAYRYVSQTQVWYQLPASLTDHLKQSVRFHHSPRVFDQDFGSSIVQKAYTLPFATVMIVSARYFIKQPLLFMSYLSLLLYTKLISMMQPTVSTTWSVASTSKQTGIYDG